MIDKDEDDSFEQVLAWVSKHKDYKKKLRAYDKQELSCSDSENEKPYDYDHNADQNIDDSVKPVHSCFCVV